MHAQDLPWTMFLMTLVLIAQAILLLEHRDMQTHKLTEATECYTHTTDTASIGINHFNANQ